MLELSKLKEKEVLDSKNDFTNKKQIRELKKQIGILFLEINSLKKSAKSKVVSDMNLNIGNEKVVMLSDSSNED